MTATEREGAPGKRRGKKRRHPLRTLAILAGVAVGGAVWFHWQCWGFQATRTEVELKGLPGPFDGQRVVQISDLHGHEYGEGNRDLLEMVRGEAPSLSGKKKRRRDGRPRPIEAPLRSDRQKDSTQHKSLMRPYYLHDDD